ncbi:hypothetical protein K0U07_03240 [bacterium]|nr:hypothetical protein [bacterium]
MHTLLANLLGFSFLFGALPRLEAPQEIDSHWEEKVLSTSHEILPLDQIVKEMTSGMIDDTFDENFIQKIKYEISKNKNGEYIEYWPSGQIKAKLPYKNGKAHGHIHGWYNTGEDAFKGYFQNGVRQGVHVTCYQSRCLDGSHKARLLQYDQNGVFDCEQQRYHSNNKIAICIPYSQGKVDGTLYAWDENGKEYIELEYEYGKLLKTPPPPNFYRKNAPCRYEKYVNEITAAFIKDAKKKYGAKATGSGGRMPWDVVRFGADFSLQMHAEKEQAKDILFDLMQMLVKRVNEHEKIRPYLREYPFPMKSASIAVSFLKDKFDPYKDGSITTTTVSTKNELVFYSYDPTNLKKEIRKVEPFIEPGKD